MLSTGIRTPVGVKVLGTDLAEMEKLARQIEAVVRTVPGTTSAYAERVIGGYYLNIDPGPRAARPLRPDGRRPAEHDRHGARRRAGDDDGRGPRALHRQHPLSARLPQRPAGDRHGGADSDGRRRDRAARPGRQGRPSRRAPPASAPRTRSSPSTSSSICATAISAATSPTRRRRSPRRSSFRPATYVAWSGQFEYLERAKARLQIVVPVTLADHLPAALSQFPPRDRDPDRHAVGAVRAGRRPVADVVARLQSVGRRRGRLHRAGRRRRRNRRRDADLSRPRAHGAAGASAAPKGGRSPATISTPRSWPARSSACGPR